MGTMFRMDSNADIGTFKKMNKSSENLCFITSAKSLLNQAI